MDTQPVEEIGVDAIETGHSPSPDPVASDTAEHCADSPGQPAELANLQATEVPKNDIKEEENKDPADKVTEDTDKPGETTSSQEEPARQELEVKEDTSEQSSGDPAGANVEPEVDPAGANVEPVKEPEGALATPKGEEQEDGKTPAKKPKVAEEDTTTEPKKVFCEE